MFSWTVMVFSRPWNEYTKKYNLKFKNNEDEKKRHLKFLENSEMVSNINEDFKQGKSNFYTELNHLSIIVKHFFKPWHIHEYLY